jgi:hypothetical protein
MAGTQGPMTDPVLITPQQKKRWSDLTAGQQAAIVLGAVVELMITSIAVRDLVRRPARDVRGWKALWVLLFTVQPVGPIAYFLVGRRHARS